MIGRYKEAVFMKSMRAMRNLAIILTCAVAAAIARAGESETAATHPHQETGAILGAEFSLHVEAKETAGTADDAGRPIWEWAQLTDNWLGSRSWMEEKGFIFSAVMTMDWSYATRRKDREQDAFRYLINANATVDFEKLAGWKGATLFANFQNKSGPNFTDTVGAIQGPDNMDGPNRTQISELWFEQTAFDGALRIKIGKVDANTEFAAVETAGEFLNSSFGFSPTIVGMPTYPDPAMSINIFVQPTKNFYFGAGIYDGSSVSGSPTGNRGPAKFFNDPAGYFIIGETGATWDMGGRAAKLALGGWHHTAKFERFDGASQRGASGAYLTAEQSLWNAEDKQDDARGIDAFAQIGFADPNVSAAAIHASLGAAWTGPIPGRDNDILGIAATWIRTSSAVGAPYAQSCETALELFYKIQITQYWSIKPNLQYISHPGGEGESDVFVFTMRMQLSF
jgi:carbohydrate-selective porin OprB